MTKQVIKMAAVLAIVACMSAAPVQAGPIVPPTYGVGNSMMTTPTVLDFWGENNHWEIQDNQARPLELYYSPNAGPLRKILGGYDPSSDQPITLTEHFHVYQEPNWTDWHQQIVSPGFFWTGSPILSIDSTGDEIMGIISPDGTQVDFLFPTPLVPCTTITINKSLFCDGSVQTKEIIIDQWPTVPEPGTIVLLGAGLIALAAYAWRKRK